MRLTKDQSAQVAPVESKRADARGHRPESGINAATRELGIDRTEAPKMDLFLNADPFADFVFHILACFRFGCAIRLAKEFGA